MTIKRHNTYAHTVKGWRTIGGQKFYFKSKWEINIAYYLEWLRIKGQIDDWCYEADTFWFEQIRRGVRSYTPDFKIFDKDGSVKYIEVKGWMDSKSATKLKRMKKYYPNVKVDLIDKDEYKVLKDQISRLCNWE